MDERRTFRLDAGIRVVDFQQNDVVEIHPREVMPLLVRVVHAKVRLSDVATADNVTGYEVFASQGSGVAKGQRPRPDFAERSPDAMGPTVRLRNSVALPASGAYLMILTLPCNRPSASLPMWRFTRVTAPRVL